jgi:hypothetical protein
MADERPQQEPETQEVPGATPASSDTASGENRGAAKEQIANLQKELEGARREAANFRGRLREVEPEAAKAKSVEEQLSELRKAMADRN